jgi:competence protein ComGE
MMDLLLSLSAWMLVASAILPMVIELMVDSVNEKNKFAATTILYAKLHEQLIQNQLPIYQIIVVKGKLYEIIPSADLKEVCIQFEDKNQDKKRVCEFWE